MSRSWRAAKADKQRLDEDGATAQILTSAHIVGVRLDGEAHRALRARAARHGRSTSGEAHEILRAALASDQVRSTKTGLGRRIAALFAGPDEPAFDE